MCEQAAAGQRDLAGALLTALLAALVKRGWEEDTPQERASLMAAISGQHSSGRCAKLAAGRCRVWGEGITVGLGAGSSARLLALVWPSGMRGRRSPLLRPA